MEERTGPGFAAALEPLLRDRAHADEVGARGREYRAKELFSFERTLRETIEPRLYLGWPASAPEGPHAEPVQRGLDPALEAVALSPAVQDG